MKWLVRILFTITLFISCAPKVPRTIELETGWKFHTGDNLDWAKTEGDFSDWKDIRPDRLWENQGYDGYDGYGWYRIKVIIPSSLRSSAVLKDSLQIVLGAIDDTDQTFLNGYLIGQNAVTQPANLTTIPENFTGNRSTYNITRRYVLSTSDPRIKWDQENVLAVRANDHGGGGGMYSQIPTLSMIDINDYISLDITSKGFQISDITGYEKTIVIGNSSTQHDFSGKLSIEVIQFEPRKILFKKSYRMDLPEKTQTPFSFQFKASPNYPCQVNYSFTEKSGIQMKTSQEAPYILTPPAPATPRINGASVYGARQGRPFLYRIPATGVRPMTFSAEGLPPGLQLDTQTGIITGIVGKESEFNVTLTAKNAHGEYSLPFKIIIGDKIALTPQLGWNSWNCWGVTVDEVKVQLAADMMVSTGLADHGWTYINIDDGWEAPERTAKGEIATNEKFPDMKALSDYVHSKGLKLGIYSSPGPLTCGGYTGSYQHEIQDAKSYASWGIDYLKYDWCSYGSIATDAGRAELQKPYILMRKALDMVPRDILFSLCQYGMGNVWEWGGQVGGNSWRTTGDITDTWKSMTDIGFEQTVQWQHAEPGHWNDPDMLVVGWVGWGPSLHPTRLTVNEQYTHISLWALLTSPLLLGCDLTKLDDFTLNLLTNDEVLAVNQDPLGVQAKRIIKMDPLQVWAKPLSDGSLAVGLFNMAPREINSTIKWQELGLTGAQKVRDLWRQTDMGSYTDSFSTMVLNHGVVLIKVSSIQ
jgi:alpha-galactosidase